MFVLNTNFLLNIKLHNIEIILAMNVAMLILKNALLKLCAGHGMSSVGDKPTTGSYRQV